MKSTNTAETLEKLRQIFSVFGLPDKIVSDNGTSFTSKEFEEFVKKNGIIHTRVSPYHPASNGLAERAVQCVKRGIACQTAGSMETKLARFLFTHRNTPHCVTGQTPSELLLGRKVKTILSRLHPDLSQTVAYRQEKQKEYHDRKAKLREFVISSRVYVRDVLAKKWLSGTVEKRLGPVTYIVRLQDNRLWKRHVDHIRPKFDDGEDSIKDVDKDWDFVVMDRQENVSPGNNRVPNSFVPRRSSRQRRTPDWYHDKY